MLLPQYTPSQIRETGAFEVEIDRVEDIKAVSIVRRLRIDRASCTDGLFRLHTAQLARPLTIAEQQIMKFGDEQIAAREYFKRVIEQGDLIDAAVEAADGDGFPIRSYWIHIEYVGTAADTAKFSRKDDGDFAMRAKAGEKAERVTARYLRNEYGHIFTDDRYDSPGFFEIWYAGKKVRKPDLRCLRCGFTIEVKKRNNDQKYRISHSDSRPFAEENDPNGWHAFIFPDMSLHFASNSDILLAIAAGRSQPGNNKWDRWEDIDPAAITEHTPPVCSGTP